MPKLLVIEDEDSLRDSVTDLLEAEGYEVVQAENGLIGVQHAEEYIPDLVICDIMMPMLDGYDVLDRLRHTPATADIPVIFLTARTEQSSRDAANDHGPTEYLTKPFTRAALLAAVETQLKQQAVIRPQVESSRPAE